jgi:hypothetical protein
MAETNITNKINDNFPVNLGEGETLSLDQLAQLVGPLGVGPVVDNIRAIIGHLVFRKVFDFTSPAQIQDLINVAIQNDPDYQPPQFQNFLQVECPPDFDAEALAAVLRSWSGVIDSAETVLLEDPNVVGTTNPFFNQQGYLAPAPTGISVQSAWAKGADGTNIRFIDLEQAWFLQHQDLPQNIPLIHGAMRPSDFGHGTAVLGVVLAIDNTTGVVGIAPNANTTIISVAGSAGAGEIMLAAVISSPGGVMLLEFTVGGRLPAELDSAIFEAIRLATTAGMIVIEAAGNANADLDTVTFRGDSGAIMVGGCTSDFPHKREGSSNFGSRIDCHAWAENVFTAGERPNPPTIPPRPDSYFNFSGTSSASAIVAGVCILIQDLQLRIGSNVGNPGLPLPPVIMRQIVSDPANGTDSFSIFDRIGPMPDLAKIVSNILIN